jgi:hypothetical protein
MYTPNDLLLLFIKDLGNQYFWWASKIRDDPGCPGSGTTTSLLDFRNPDDEMWP